MIPVDNPLFPVLDEAARSRRVVLFAGLPGVGKSLLVKAFAGLAQGAGRRVHLLQWDVARAAFETPALLARYPEVAGVTHAGIRKAVGLWARERVPAWHRAHPDPAHLLVGEVPLIGNRLVELAQTHADDAEALLAGDATLVLVPVPSREVRAHIEGARRRTTLDPSHEREAADAPPAVLRALWDELHALAAELAIAPGSAEAGAPYDPRVYGDVYLRLLNRRQARLLPIEELFEPGGSVYALDALFESELTATPAEVARAAAAIEGWTMERLEASVERWYEV